MNRISSIVLILILSLLILPSCIFRRVVDSPGYNGIVIDSISGLPLEGVAVFDFPAEGEVDPDDSFLTLTSADGHFFVAEKTQRKLISPLVKIPVTRNLFVRHPAYEEKRVFGYRGDMRIVDTEYLSDTIFLKAKSGE